MHLHLPSSAHARHKIVLGFPTPGGISMSFETARALYRGTQRHDLALLVSVGSWDGFNSLWANALNLAAAGEATHFAMLHADVAPQEGWLDILADELDRLQADLVSAIVPLKDARGVTSSGIGDPCDPWHPLKRFTMRELFAGEAPNPKSEIRNKSEIQNPKSKILPETFDAADAGFPGGILLHNDGCMMADLRNPIFRQENPDGTLIADFQFPRQVYRDLSDGLLHVRGESEDWYFSRKLHELGARTYVTRKVRLVHVGSHAWTNAVAWGTYEHDQDTKAARPAGGQ
ncbi:MAG: hypothetical protein ABSA30_00050 [Candidatus Aminicenantales bacterium]|jgi:hypothetical protein